MNSNKHIPVPANQAQVVVAVPSVPSTDTVGVDSKSAPLRRAVKVPKELPLYSLQKIKIKIFQNQIKNLVEGNGLYSKLLNDLKKFQEEHCPNCSNLFSRFYSKELFDLIFEDNVRNEIIRNEFLTLMQNLVSLKNVLPQDKDTILYQLSYEVLMRGIVLAQDIMSSQQNWRHNLMKTDINNRKEKIVALSAAIQASTMFIQSNGQVDNRALITAINEMRQEVEGPAIFQKENRLWCGFLGALSMLAGFCLFAVAAVTVPFVIPLILMTAASISLVFTGFKLLDHALNQDKNHSLARRVETANSRETAGSVQRLVNYNPALFSKKIPSIDLAPISSGQARTRTNRAGA